MRKLLLLSVGLIALSLQSAIAADWHGAMYPQYVVSDVKPQCRQGYQWVVVDSWLERHRIGRRVVLIRVFEWELQPVTVCWRIVY